MNYTSEELRELLLENDYPASDKRMLQSVVEQLQHLTPEGRKAFEWWLDTRKLPDFDIEGVTVKYLKTYHHSTDLGVILAYDGLVRNPKSAYLLKKPVIKHVEPTAPKVSNGVLTFNDGTRYTGDYVNGLPHGRGLMVYSNGAVYDGEWKEGRREGAGQYFQPSGALMSGTWHLGHLVQGVSVDANGNRYAGTFMNGKFNGKGALFLKDGSWGQGVWEDDELKDGRVYYADGRLCVIENKQCVSEQVWRS